MAQRILYVGMQYDYGDPRRGLSYEHRNFHASLKRYCAERSWEFEFFDFMAFGKEHGLDALSEELLRRCRQFRPGLLFSVLFHPDADPRYEVFREISRSLGVITCNWFCDDQWRFEDYTSVVAPYFNYFCTTSQAAVSKYEAAGLGSGMIKSQWACNIDLYRPSTDGSPIDVSFIGQPHGNRAELVEHLRSAGVPVEVFGFGWSGRPRVPFHQMVRLFSRSRINLNLSKASVREQEQIKGRNFEVPGCGGFQLSFDAENLTEYYVPDREIVLVSSIEEMADKARFYLSHEAERRAIAQAGYERTLREHSWTHRLDQIFARIQVSAAPPVHIVDQVREETRKDSRIDELLRVNRELWESRSYFVRKIETLEAEVLRRQGAIEDQIRLTTASNEGIRAREAEIRRLTQDHQKMVADYHALGAQAHHFRLQVTALENTIRGLTALKIFRLRDAIQSEASVSRKLARIVYLMGAMAVPGAVRRRLSPMTIALKRRVGILPPDPSRAVSVRQKPWPADRPLLSVIVPSYNYGRFIRTALDSILNQTFQNYEVLVIDCSTDPDTIRVVKEIDHPKVKVIFREGRHLLGDNRNFGISMARGKYVTCLDPDDILKPTYYEKAIYILEQGNFDIVSPSVQEFEQGDQRWMLHVRPSLAQIVECNLISVVAVYNRNVWVKSRGFHDYGMEAQHVHEDWDFWIRSLSLGARVMNIREPLMWYRIHGNNMSKAKNLPSLDEQRKQIFAFNSRTLHERSIERSAQFNQIRFAVEDGLVNLLPAKPVSPDPRTILFALPYAVVGGAHKRFLELAHFLRQQGYRIVVVTTVPVTEDQVDLLREYEAVTADIFPLPEVLADQLEWFEFIEYLVRSRGVGTMLLGGSQFLYDHLGLLRQKFPALKVVDQQFNLAVHFNNNRSHCAEIDVTIAENDTIVRRIRELDSRASVRCELIENGVDTQREFNPEVCPMARPPEIPRNAVVVSFIGRMSHEKGPDLFLEIVERLRDRDDLHFILAGPGPMLDGLRHDISRRHLESRVWTPGSVNTREFLSCTDILVLPSRLDGRPNIVLEALSLGVPVVAADVGGVSTLLQDGKTGLLCRAEQIDQFVECILSLIDDPQKCQQMKTLAREYAVAHLDCMKFLPRYLEIFDSLAGGASDQVLRSA